MRRQTAYWLMGAIVLAFFVAWTLRESGSNVGPTELEAVQIGEIHPLTRWEEIYLGGQPSPKDLQALRAQGFETIINLRKVDETDWDESEAVAKLGMHYVHLPFSSPAELTDELFDKALENLAAAEEGKRLLHCASSNRVGAIWYAYRRLEGGLSAEAAEQEARSSGLRSSNLLEVAREYVANQQSATN